MLIPLPDCVCRDLGEPGQLDSTKKAYCFCMEDTEYSINEDTEYRLKLLINSQWLKLESTDSPGEKADR